MESIKVKDFTDVYSIQMSNKLSILTEPNNNIVNNITISKFNENIISSDTDNIINIGTDGKLFAQTASISEEIGDLNDLETVDNSSIVNAINEIATTTVNGANSDLSNLTSEGNSKFQFAPFSINNGSVTNGENATLYLPNGTEPEITATYQAQVSTATDLLCAPCTITTADNKTKTFENGNLLDCSSVTDGTYKVMKSYANGSLSLAGMLYISKEDVSGGTISAWTQPALSANGTMGGDSFACEASSTAQSSPAYRAFDKVAGHGWIGNSVPQWLTFYNPQSLNVTQIIIGDNSGGVTYCPKDFDIQGSNDNTNWTTIKTFSGNVSSGNRTLDLSNNTKYYKYHRFYVRSVATSNTDYVLISYVRIIATQRTGEILTQGDLWLDTSQYPLTLKQYDGTNWQINNDLVYIGDVTVGSGVITAIKNNYFNACPARRDLVDSYQNGTTWYAVYSDGWCEQGGYAIQTSYIITIYLLKNYINTNYSTYLTESRNSTSNSYASVWFDNTGTKTVSSFNAVNYTGLSSSNGVYWQACGYIKE